MHSFSSQFYHLIPRDKKTPKKKSFRHEDGSLCSALSLSSLHRLCTGGTSCRRNSYNQRSFLLSELSGHHNGRNQDALGSQNVQYHHQLPFLWQGEDAGDRNCVCVQSRRYTFSKIRAPVPGQCPDCYSVPPACEQERYYEQELSCMRGVRGCY